MIAERKERAMPTRIMTVDAFTDRPFSGNPAGVCLLDAPADEGWMRAVAAEMNLAETAFLHPEGVGYRLRWFTPAREVRLCGHATLASAHVLWQDGCLTPEQPARFETLSGTLVATRGAHGIELDLPLWPVTPCDAPAELLRGLGATPLAVTRDATNFLVELASDAEVRALQPDFAQLARLEPGVIVTARSDAPEYDFVSRYFAPSWGIPEDPVTGSAHCSLAPYWRDRLGKSAFIGYQASHRGGTVGVRIEGDRAILSGQAITVLRGELMA
jgi:predicted PhzF superfamily epimerase YddE/YHI9